jgi:hypothetical protein
MKKLTKLKELEDNRDYPDYIADIELEARLLARYHERLKDRKAPGIFVKQIEYVLAAYDIMEQNPSLKKDRMFLRTRMPYHVYREGDFVILLNRNYQPLSPGNNYTVKKQLNFSQSHGDLLFIGDNVFMSTMIHGSYLYTDATSPWISTKHYVNYLRNMNDLIMNLPKLPEFLIA